MTLNYEQYLEHYQTNHQYDIIQVTPNQRFLDMARECIREAKPKRILDVGCGPGHFSGPLSDNAYAMGMDINRKALRYCRQHYPNYKTKFGDARELPFKDNSFDFVICTNVLEHIPETGMVLEEIRRVLQPNGILLISVPNGLNIPNYMFDCIRQTQRVRKLFKLRRRMDPGFRHHYHEFSIFSLKHHLNPFRITRIINGGFWVSVLNRTIKTLNPSIFRNRAISLFLGGMLMIDIWFSKIDVFHVFPEQWIILCEKALDSGEGKV